MSTDGDDNSTKADTRANSQVMNYVSNLLIAKEKMQQRSTPDLKGGSPRGDY